MQNIFEERCNKRKGCSSYLCFIRTYRLSARWGPEEVKVLYIRKLTIGIESMKILNVLFLLSVSAISFSLSKSFAACSIARPGDCVSGIEDTLNGGPDRNEIHITNKCSKTINAAVNYLPSPQNNGSGWQENAWYPLAPGASAFIGYSRTRYFYAYAETPDKTLVWKGDKCFTFPGAGNRSLCATQVDMGSKITKYTYSFSCN
jgi:hypothetical protein